MTGVRIDTSCKDIYTNICIAITDENTQMLNNSIPTKNIKSIIGANTTKALDSYLILEIDNNNWIVKEFLI